MIVGNKLYIILFHFFKLILYYFMSICIAELVNDLNFKKVKLKKKKKDIQKD